jgi:hypothetical protein
VLSLGAQRLLKRHHVDQAGVNIVGIASSNSRTTTLHCALQHSGVVIRPYLDVRARQDLIELVCQIRDRVGRMGRLA